MLKPVVVGPPQVPRVESEQEARQAPYRAILSALMHADEVGAERVARAAFLGAEVLPSEERDLWRELVALSLASNEVAKQALEAMMNVQEFRDKSVWFREGRQEGVQTGRVEEARRAVERVLRKRRLTLSTDQQAKLQGCQELTTLERWLDQALDATTADEALR